MSLDFLEILDRRKKNKISQGGVWADLTPPPICDSWTSDEVTSRADYEALGLHNIENNIMA